MVNIFRNVVDHGIEYPDIRILGERMNMEN